ncbi:hypothetical protein H072_8170 [Dactylellina haptotyla CBS 200.50]|uniref:Ankyrin repeat protein n=1 Tax=Dactylellina haptotyla (strain CBS 200.50) TaxID=1284197 RepID=S8A5N8_DACHA|nr:hypothetical protein H072_8170 [Dactylellina haptotyla CBS 200.50]
MATTRTLPQIPADMGFFLEYLTDRKDQPVRDLMRPYTLYERQLRTLFAQDPSHPALSENTLGLVPIYEGKEDCIQIKARDLEIETEEEKAKYIIPLEPERRKKTGDRAIVGLAQFRRNFRVFTGMILESIDWNNIVVCGGSVVFSMVSVPEEKRSHLALEGCYYRDSFRGNSNMLLKREHAEYNCSDVNIYIYGLEPETAINRLKTLQKAICEELPIGSTTICVRTKDFVTIVSDGSCRPIKINLRIFTSISHVLYSQHFDVDSACVAYDGQQVYSTPQAVASWVLQCNIADPSRCCSPSFYESRLCKYQKRGFEIYYPNLRRQDIDPSIYRLPKNQHHEIRGLAKLLIFEKQSFSERESDIKEENMEDGVGVLRYFLRNADTWEIERRVTCHDRDLNELDGKAQKDRNAYLHRHPAFLGSLEDVLEDCCEYCPQPQTAAEQELQAQDDEDYIRGKLILRQEPATFVPISEEFWTETAYFRGDATIYQVIADGDTEKIKKWVSATQHDTVKKMLNTRDYTGRMPIHLAALASSPAMVDLLINLGAKISSLSIDGGTALHIAAARGSAEIVNILLLKSEENEETKQNMITEYLRAKRHMADGKHSGTDESEVTSREDATSDVESLDDDIELVSENWDDASLSVSVHTGTSSFVRVTKKTEAEQENIGDMADFDDILDINMPDNANGMTPLHHAILNGHEEVVKLLVSEFGADILRPLHKKAMFTSTRLIPLVLVSLISEKQKREDMLRTLFKLGATSRQLDISGVNVFALMLEEVDVDCLKIMFEEDGAGALAAAQATTRGGEDRSHDFLGTRVLKYIFHNGDEDKILLLLEKGVLPNFRYNQDRSAKLSLAEVAINMDMVKVFAKLIEYGIDPSECVKATRAQVLNASPYFSGSGSIGDLNLIKMTFLDLIQAKITAYEYELEYLNMILEYEPDSYEQWVASEIVREYETELEPERYPRYLRIELNIAKVIRRKSTLERNISCYRECREWLISKGGRTFADLEKRDSTHPTIPVEAESSKAEKREASLRFSPGPLPNNIMKGPDGKPKIHFRYSHAPDDVKWQEAYHELFKAAWIGDLPTLKKYSLGGWDNDATASPLRFDVKNQNGASLRPKIAYQWGIDRDQDQAFGFIRKIQDAQDHLTEVTEDYSDVQSGELPRKPDAVPVPRNARQSGAIIRCPGNLRLTLNAIREDDVAALEKLLEKHGIYIVLSSEIDLTGQVEPPKRELGYYGLKVRGEREEPWILHRSIDGKITIDTEFHHPPALYAAFWGSRKVYDWLETDGPEKALRRYEQRFGEGTYMEEFDNCFHSVDCYPEECTQNNCNLTKGKKDFLLKLIRGADGGTIQRWMGVGHPLILHIAVLNRLETWGPQRTEEEKIAHHRSNFQYLISKMKPNSLEYKDPQNNMTPLLTAASIRNKCALQALIIIGANFYAVSESLVARRNLFHYMLESYPTRLMDSRLTGGYPANGICDRFEDCLAILPMEFVEWVVLQKDTPLVELFKAADKMNEPARSHWMKVVLDRSRGAGANIRDHRGELLIHSATLRSHPAELQNILDMHPPDILFAENVDGRTALEIASGLRYKILLEKRYRRFISDECFENPKILYTWEDSNDRLWGERGTETTGEIRHEEWGTKFGEPECIQVWKMLSVAQEKAIQRIGRARKVVLLSEVNEAINKMAKPSQRVEGWVARRDNILACWMGR